jgi:hypothetical protein
MEVMMPYLLSPPDCDGHEQEVHLRTFMVMNTPGASSINLWLDT